MSIAHNQINAKPTNSLSFKQIESYEQYKEIACQSRKQIGRGIGNFTLLPNQIKTLIEKNELLYALNKYGLFILRRYLEYFQFYFTIIDSFNSNSICCANTESKKTPDFNFFSSCDLPIVCEIPYLESSEYAQISDILEKNEHVNKSLFFLQSIGFCIRRTSRRLATQPSISEHKSQLGITYLSMDLCDEGLELLNQNFNTYCDYIPTLDEWQDAIYNKRVLCILNNEKINNATQKDAMICALLHYDVCRNMSELRHLVVSPEFRGHCLANKLVLSYLNKCAKLKFKSNLWVCDNNAIALHIYKQCGYVYNGVRAIEMIANL